MKCLVTASMILSISVLTQPAFAQSSQQPSPELEAIGAKLMQEINAGIQCNANAVAGRREIESLKAKIKELEEKLNVK